MTLYRERLWPSPALLVSFLLLIPATLLVFVPVDVAVGAVVAVVLYLGVTAVFLAISPTITVDDSGLSAGQARLPASALGEVQAFDGDDARAERGPRLDARAHLVIRGGIGPVVRVTVDDDDPTPYWLISTRNPVGFADALEQVRQRTPGR